MNVTKHLATRRQIVRSNAEPAVWLQNTLRPDGAPYDLAEVEVIRRITIVAR